MIQIPSEFYIDSALRVGSIFKLTAPELITTAIPHYFIVVVIDEEENHMLLCTTQKDNKVQHFKDYGYELNGLVCIEKDKCNCLTAKESWVNCNEYYSLSRDELIKKRDEGRLIHVGEISYNHFDQLRNGIKESTVNDLPDELLIHPND